MKKKMIPKLKKKVSSFLSSEEGKITKESILKTGVVLGTLALIPALSDVVSATHASHANSLADSTTTPVNTLQTTYQASGGNVEATHSNVAGVHTNHGNHASHASHGSHGSHGSHNSW